MSEQYPDEHYERHDELSDYFAIDAATRTEVEISQLMEEHINRDDVSRWKEIIIDENGKEKEVIHYRNQDERTAYIIQSTLTALQITPNTPELFDDLASLRLDPAQRANARHALAVEEAMRAARKTLTEAQARLSKVEFSEFMLDLMDDVQREKSEADLFQAFQILRTFSIDRSDLVPAHCIALVMLHQTI